MDGKREEMEYMDVEFMGTDGGKCTNHDGNAATQGVHMHHQTIETTRIARKLRQFLPTHGRNLRHRHRYGGVEGNCILRGETITRSLRM